MANSDFKARFIATIETTGDPLAPFILQDAHASTIKLGKLMTAVADERVTTNHATTLLQGFPTDMEHIAGDPNFVCALCSLLASAIVSYGANLNRKPPQ